MTVNYLLNKAARICGHAISLPGIARRTRTWAGDTDAPEVPDDDTIPLRGPCRARLSTTARTSPMSLLREPPTLFFFLNKLTS